MPPAWLGPPGATLPGAVGLELVLAESDTVAVCVGRLDAYPTGFAFTVHLFAVPGSALAEDPEGWSMALSRAYRPIRGPELPDDMPRFGVQFATGEKATTLGRAWSAETPPSAPVLFPRGGGGGGTDWHQDLWVWPLPPDGPLSFVFAWPVHGICEARAEIDGREVREAAGRARRLWPDRPGSVSSGGGAVSVTATAAAPAPHTAAPSNGGPVSPSNVEPLARGFAGWGRNNPAGLRELMHPDFELVVPESVPYGGTFRGAEAAIGWFTRELWRWFDEFTSTPEGLIDGGDQIVVPVHVQARAKNGRTMDVHNVWVYEFRDGRLIRGRVYADTAILRDTVDGLTPE